MESLSWNQIDKKKKVEPFDILSHQYGNVCNQHNRTIFAFWFLLNISVQQKTSQDNSSARNSLSFPLFCPKLEEALYKQQEQHS